ncbi:putative nucleotide-binding protein [Pseudarthrobacter sp. W1I19]|uniref:TIR domain-containing protein n=1 Tax=Pseudarthrobacter sp. W1I19 TaxID=3042288 RepID=UPI002785F07F|nr:TIR domain-containing protein [Pseudarthrobacter sp. W1I19]MDQ0923335.1 putative nucleotide-binding protein [Pseudarthrobacter sp. W1I19]
MKVFISWSGEVSQHAAQALRNWIPQVLQSIEPWLASTDARPGHLVAHEIQQNLQDASAVLLCLTRQNMLSESFRDEYYALQEAGPLIMPVCIDFSPNELGRSFPSNRAVALDSPGIRSLVTLLNELSDDPLNQTKLDRLLGIWSPKLEEELATALPSLNFKSEGKLKLIGTRTDKPTEAVLSEILGEVRSLSGRLNELQAAVLAISSGATEPREPVEPLANPRPRIFIGSSAEGLPVAEQIQANLDYVAECTVWNQNLFQPSMTTIETLVESAVSFDCAVIVLTADDILTMRDSTAPVARDNLIFELGLFTGLLGRAKTFMVKSREDQIHLPSDLNGVTALDYAGRRTDGNLSAALSPVCLRIRAAMGIA